MKRRLGLLIISAELLIAYFDQSFLSANFCMFFKNNFQMSIRQIGIKEEPSGKSVWG